MTPETAAREAKAKAIADVLRRCMTPGSDLCGDKEPITMEDITQKDTPEFWRIIIEKAGVRRNSRPGATGRDFWISPETRAETIRILEGETQ